MAQYYTLPTEIGQAKIANAIALGMTITISELAIGDGGGTTPVPDSNVTALVNQVRRAPINTSVVDPDNPSWIVVEQVLPPDIGGWTIREIGLYDADGDLIAYGNYPETYKPVLSEGSGRTQTIRFVMQVSDTAAVTLKVDPSVVLATREYVDDGIAEHAASRNHPDATTTDKGFVRKATSTEAKGRSSTIPVVTPAGLGAALTEHEQGQNHPAATEAAQGMVKLATQSDVHAGTDNTLAVTPATLSGNNATHYRPGVVELATQTETDAGIDNSRAVTPATLAGRVATESLAGVVELASVGEAADYLNGTHALTAASFIAGVLGAGSLAPGYAAFPYRDGTTGELKRLIIQVGSTISESTVTFPIAFPVTTAPYVVATPYSDTAEASAVGAATATQFTWHSPASCRWIAIGY